MMKQDCLKFWNFIFDNLKNSLSEKGQDVVLIHSIVKGISSNEFKRDVTYYKIKDGILSHGSKPTSDYVEVTENLDVDSKRTVYGEYMDYIDYKPSDLPQFKFTNLLMCTNSDESGKTMRYNQTYFIVNQNVNQKIADPEGQRYLYLDEFTYDIMVDFKAKDFPFTMDILLLPGYISPKFVVRDGEHDINTDRILIDIFNMFYNDDCAYKSNVAPIKLTRVIGKEIFKNMTEPDMLMLAESANKTKPVIQKVAKIH